MKSISELESRSCKIIDSYLVNVVIAHHVHVGLVAAPHLVMHVVLVAASGGVVPENLVPLSSSSSSHHTTHTTATTLSSATSGMCTPSGGRRVNVRGEPGGGDGVVARASPSAVISRNGRGHRRPVHHQVLLLSLELAPHVELLAAAEVVHASPGWHGTRDARGHAPDAAHHVRRPVAHASVHAVVEIPAPVVLM